MFDECFTHERGGNSTCPQGAYFLLNATNEINRNKITETFFTSYERNNLEAEIKN